MSFVSTETDCYPHLEISRDVLFKALAMKVTDMNRTCNVCVCLGAFMLVCVYM